MVVEEAESHVANLLRGLIIAVLLLQRHGGARDWGNEMVFYSTSRRSFLPSKGAAGGKGGRVGVGTERSVVHAERMGAKGGSGQRASKTRWLQTARHGMLRGRNKVLVHVDIDLGDHVQEHLDHLRTGAR